jgi:cobalt/nickel transport system permease protein
MIAEEPFALGRSRIHDTSPVQRVLAAALYTALVAVLSDPVAMVMALLFSSIMVAAANIRWREIARRALAVNVFILIIWLVLPLTYEGATLWTVGPIGLSRPGVWLAAKITMKSNAIFLAFIALIATMNLSTLGQTLYRLGIPTKLVYMLLMTYRYLSVIEQEFDRLHRAAMIRGFRARTNLHTYRTYAYLTAMVFIRAWSRAERVYQAMKCRGFNGRFHSLQPPSMPSGIGFSITMSLFVAGLLAQEWAGMFWS